MASHAGPTGRVVAAAQDLARLVLPVECPGCERSDEVMCEACAKAFAGPVRRCEADVPRLDRMDGLPPLPVWAVAGYVGPVRGAVVAWKDKGRRDLTPRLVAVARRAGQDVAVVLGGATDARGRRVGGLLARTVQVVPVPSTPRARRRRGADLVRLLAGGVAEGLSAGGVRGEPALVLRRGTATDQVGLGARARNQNAGAVTVRRAADPRGCAHVLVDDVVTTGATLAACCRCLESAGGIVLGAVVLAATPPPRGACALRP
jgi:predicted amidophosphoribosyltransferase